MYCEKCCSLFDGAVRTCPVCGSRKVRYPRVDDPCFLTEKGSPWGEMLFEVLRRKNIAFLKRPVLGAGIALKLGQGLERYRFYVRYDQMEDAKTVMERMFPEE